MFDVFVVECVLYCLYDLYDIVMSKLWAALDGIAHLFYTRPISHLSPPSSNY